MTFNRQKPPTLPADISANGEEMLKNALGSNFPAFNEHFKDAEAPKPNDQPQSIADLLLDVETPAPTLSPARIQYTLDALESVSQNQKKMQEQLCGLLRPNTTAPQNTDKPLPPKL